MDHFRLQLPVHFLCQGSIFLFLCGISLYFAGIDLLHVANSLVFCNNVSLLGAQRHCTYGSDAHLSRRLLAFSAQTPCLIWTTAQLCRKGHLQMGSSSGNLGPQNSLHPSRSERMEVQPRDGAELWAAWGGRSGGGLQGRAGPQRRRGVKDGVIRGQNRPLCPAHPSS